LFVLCHHRRTLVDPPAVFECYPKSLGTKDRAFSGKKTLSMSCDRLRTFKQIADQQNTYKVAQICIAERHSFIIFNDFFSIYNLESN
jgi:hypothetical protein